MIEHFILKCTDCGVVISQCRCMDCSKELKWSVCKDCEQKKKIVTIKN